MVWGATGTLICVGEAVEPGYLTSGWSAQEDFVWATREARRGGMKENTEGVKQGTWLPWPAGTSLGQRGFQSPPPCAQLWPGAEGLSLTG